MNSFSFPASLPDIQSAINISGGSNGARVKLDIPQIAIQAAVRLAELQGQAFTVIIKPEE